MADKATSKGYAVVETGGRQHLVRENDVFDVELMTAKEGAKVDIAPVLALSDGKTLKVGTPAIEGSKVVCTVVKHFLDDKVISFKKKRRMGYHRKVGHRQHLTTLKVEKI